jgi:hypothetical protein
LIYDFRDGFVRYRSNRDDDLMEHQAERRAQNARGQTSLIYFAPFDSSLEHALERGLPKLLIRETGLLGRHVRTHIESEPQELWRRTIRILAQQEAEFVSHIAEVGHGHGIECDVSRDGGRGETYARSPPAIEDRAAGAGALSHGFECQI